MVTHGYYQISPAISEISVRYSAKNAKMVTQSAKNRENTPVSQLFKCKNGNTQSEHFFS